MCRSVAFEHLFSAHRVPTPSSYVVTWRSFDGEETLEFVAIHRPRTDLNAGHGRNMFLSLQERWLMREIRARRTTGFRTG